MSQMTLKIKKVGMTEEERMKAGCLQIASFISAFVVVVVLCALFGSCTTTKYVTVPEVYEHRHHSTDTIHKTDSVIDRQTTTIREVDSATMAQYGIQMSALQTAWLIQTERLQREISALRATRTDTVHERDSIPYPVEVVKEVPAQLTWWQRTRIYITNTALALLGITAAAWAIKKKYFS